MIKYKFMRAKWQQFDRMCNAVMQYAVCTFTHQTKFQINNIVINNNNCFHFGMNESKVQIFFQFSALDSSLYCKLGIDFARQHFAVTTTPAKYIQNDFRSILMYFEVFVHTA